MERFDVPHPSCPKSTLLLRLPPTPENPVPILPWMQTHVPNMRRPLEHFRLKLIPHSLNLRNILLQISPPNNLILLGIQIQPARIKRCDRCIIHHAIRPHTRRLRAAHPLPREIRPQERIPQTLRDNKGPREELCRSNRHRPRPAANLRTEIQTSGRRVADEQPMREHLIRAMTALISHDSSGEENPACIRHRVQKDALIFRAIACRRRENSIDNGHHGLDTRFQGLI